MTGVSVIIPVVTETTSLQETVDILMAASGEAIGQIILVTCEKTTPNSIASCEKIQSDHGEKVLTHQQRRPFLGNAIREAFDLATQSHVVMMASDMETDPRTFPALLTAARQNPGAVVTASRWMNRGSFTNYGPIRVMLNYLFQTLGRLLYLTSAADLTFGYRLFPTNLVQRIRWRYERHNFLLETILKPLRLGVPVIEVPTTWVPRPEGLSQNSLRKQAEYLRTLVGCRLIRKGNILKPEDDLWGSKKDGNESHSHNHD